jgi:hypothetical protein
MVYDIITKRCKYYFPSRLCLIYAIPFQTPKDMLWMSNTPIIVQTKIINTMVFTNYPKKGIVFFLGFGMAM